MILVGRYLSPYTRRVAVSLHLLNLPFERRPLNPWQNLDDVREINPTGRIPALILDDGEVVFESSAILDHLDQSVGPDRALMAPSGATRRAHLRAVSVGLSVMDKAAAARYELVMRPTDRIHQPWFDHNVSQVHSGLDWLEAHTIKLCGEGQLTQAAITAIVAFDFLAVALSDHINQDKYTALAALSAEAAVRPAFRQTHPQVDL